MVHVVPDCFEHLQSKASDANYSGATRGRKGFEPGQSGAWFCVLLFPMLFGVSGLVVASTLCLKARHAGAMKTISERYLGPAGGSTTLV